MASQKQIEANRKNARRSTGPKSPEGKAVSAQNATKHGLRAQPAAVLESTQNLSFEEATYADLKPIGAVDKELAGTWISNSLLLHRLDQVGRNMMGINSGFWHSDDPYESEQRAFALLARYRTSFENARYRAYHELQRRQAARAGNVVSAPAAIDFNVNVSDTEVTTAKPQNQRVREVATASGRSDEEPPETSSGPDETISPLDRDEYMRRLLRLAKR